MRSFALVYLVLSIFLYLHSLCYAECGIYKTTNGSMYDLAPLASKKDDTATVNGVTYHWNYCKNIATKDTNCNIEAPVVQIINSTICSPIGLLPATVQDHPDGSDRGVSIVYINTAEICMMTTFIISCDPNVEEQQFISLQQYDCAFVFNITSKHGCPVNKKPANKEEIEILVLGFFLIMFVIAVPVIVFVCYRRYKKLKKDSVPLLSKDTEQTENDRL